MVELAHEVWEDPDNDSFEFGLPHAKIDASRQETEPNARRLHVIWASTYQAAMRAYYEWQDWGEYLTHGDEDVVYTADQLEEQKKLRPELYTAPTE